MIFVDNSGSVGSCTTYWQTVSDINTQYAKDISHYYFWNSSYYTVTPKVFDEKCIAMRGEGGTSPELVAQVVVKEKFPNIILITDGEVGDYSVKECDRILEAAKTQGFTINKAICYVIGSYNEPNLSVTCPFTRCKESKVFSRNGANPLKAVMQYTAEDYKVLDELENITLENFERQYTVIEQLIIALNMGKDGNLPLKNQLVAMKGRLVKEFSKKLGREGDYSSRVREQLKANNFEGAINLIENMSSQYFAQGSGELEKKILYLISLCGDLRGQYSVDQIKSNKMATAAEAVEAVIDPSVQTAELSEHPIECPIILDEDVPQILIDECEPFLLGLEKAVVDDISACPLRILSYPHLRSKLRSRLSTFTGVKYSDKLMKNPFTQNRLLGAIPLGTHKSHVAVGNRTLSVLIAKGKVMGNLNMYLAVIWVMVQAGEIEWLNPILPNLTEHLLHRLLTTKTMASMCGLSQYVATQVGSDIALWYCLSSGYLNQPTEKDTFRFHLYDIEQMLLINQTLGYPLHSGFKRHYLRTRALYNFMEKFKRLDNKGKKCFKNLFRGLYQKGFLVDSSLLSKKVKTVEVCSEFIPVDGAADEEQVLEVRKRLPKFCEGLTNEDLVYVSSLLDEHKQVEEIFLDYNVQVPALPAPEVNWSFGLEKFDHQVTISPATLRPLTKVEGRNWDQQAQEIFKVESGKDLFKGCKYIQEFILKFNQKPNLAELAVFVYNRLVESGKKNTLPFLAKEWMEYLLGQYEAAYPQDATVKDIVQILKKSRTVESRLQLETAQ